MSKIVPPSTCPSCNTELHWVNHILYCRNPKCSSQAEKKIEHFAKTLKIKGLGPSTISKLGLKSINDIYLYESPKEIEEGLSSKALADKLWDAIQSSKSVDLTVLLSAFSIPLIGKVASAKLAPHCKSIYDITEKTCRDAGIGPKATENLISWLELEFPEYKDLPFSFEFDRVEKKNNKGVVCISGKLKSYKTKADATRVLEEAGYTVKSSITKDVTILVNESGIESSKTQKARESGVMIIDNIGDLI